MTIPDIAAGFVIASIIFGIANWYLNIRLKPIKQDIKNIMEQYNTILEKISIITEGLLDNDQIPRRQK